MPAPEPDSPNLDSAFVEQPVVEVVGLVKRYGDVLALDGVSFAVPTGNVVALLGPNGAGKTTAVEVCEGFRGPDSGIVRVLGLDPRRDARALRPRVGVMLQGGGAYPAARCAEMLRLVASFARHPHDPPALLAALGLGSVAGTPVKRLSGGQRQRLSLAMAIVGRPELVFLDEPTAQVACRAAGSPSELTRAGMAGQVSFRAPAGLDLATLAGALPAGALASEPTPGHYLVESPVDPDLLAALTGWCARQNVLAEDLQVQRRSLEDVFLELTGRELRS